MNDSKLNGLEQRALAAVKPADVLQVYSGKNGKCCCGCAGQHRYGSAYAADGRAAFSRGYSVDANEVNDRQVAKVLGLLQANPAAVEKASDDCLALVVGERLYVVYLWNQAAHDEKVARKAAQEAVAANA